MLAYETSGFTGKTGILFLHGFSGTSREWREVMEGFKDDHDCVAVDLPGHGNSPLPEPDVRLYHYYLHSLEELIKSLFSKPVHLVGYSMGGRIALHFVLRFPDLIRSLTLESANPGISAAGRAERWQWEQEVIRLLRTATMDQFLKYWFDLPLFVSLRKRKDLMTYLYGLRLSQDCRALARVMEELGSSRLASLDSRFSQIRRPVLLITGERDWKYSALYNNLKRRFPEVQLAIIPEAGHNTHLENREYFQMVLKQFLMEV